jgi:MYXO-CTERM domain-containing protein
MRATVSIVLGMLLVACGAEESNETSSRISQRIVGGTQSTSAQDATVYLSIGEDGSCSGTLVAANLVLTARHCVSEYGWGGSEQCGEFTYDLPASSVKVRIGVDAQYAAAAAHAVKIFRPAGNDGCDDIALVQLDKTLTQLKPAVVRFTMPTIGEQTTAVGYGEDGFGWVQDKRWQRANLPLKAIGPTSFDYVTRSGWSLPVDVPAKTIVTGEATCYGDSGGPLFDATGAVIGITSRGVDDYCVDRPTLYTATASFETLIRSAAAAAGQPLADTAQPAPAPAEDPGSDPQEDEEVDSRSEKRTSSSSVSETEGLDEATEETEGAPEASACSASPKRSHQSAFAFVALAALVAIALRRRKKTATLSLSVTLMACSSTPPLEGTPLHGSSLRDDEATDDISDQASTGDPDGDNPSSTPSSSGSSPKPKGACSGESTQKACFECCTDKSPQAVELYTRALEGCLCDSPGTCKAACEATLCSGYKADAACADCLRTTGLSCEDSAFSACEKDPGCGPMLECASESRCSSK